MVHLSLINMKQSDLKYFFGIKKFYPIYNDLNKYQINIKSKTPVQINFCLYEKFMKYVAIKHKNITYKYNKIPTEGILISCTLTIESPIEIALEPLHEHSEIMFRQFKIIFDFQTNLVNVKWNNIFIINLKRRIDRKNDIEQKLLKQNINQYEFIEAIDGIDENIQFKFNELKKKNMTPIISSGHYACLLSHIKAIKLAKNRNYSNIMILEDDIYFCNNFVLKLSNVLVPKYDIIYLGGIINKKKLFFNDWIKYSNIMGAYGYILSSNLFDKVLDELEKLNDFIDIYYLNKIQPVYSTILLYDYIKTDLTSSDTSNKSNKLIKRLNYIKIRN